MTVKTVHPEYTKFSKKWKRVRDAFAGQDEIHAANEEYLPRLSGQPDLKYKAYKERAPFVNFSWRTAAALNGMMFRKSPTVEAPKKTEEYLKDVTRRNVPFPIFAQDVSLECLGPGRVGVLVDHPKELGVELTVAEAEKLGLRPSMQMYKTESIINWSYRMVNNKYTLSRVVLWEVVEQFKSEFENDYVNQYRVLDLDPFDKYRVRVFNDQSEQIGADVYPKMNGAKLDFIPFVFITPDGTQSQLEEPPLIDLVDINIDHYRVNADYAHAVHFTGLPTPYVTGFKKPVDMITGKDLPVELNIGSETAWLFENENTKVDYLALDGAKLGALEKRLEKLESYAAAIGARLLAPEKAGVEAEGTLIMRHAGENSIMSGIAIAVSQGLTIALGWFRDWSGEKGEAKCELNRDFLPVNTDPARITSLLALVQAGRLSPESLFDLLQRGDIIAADKTFEDEQTEIDNAPLPGPVVKTQELIAPPEKDDKEVDEEK